MTGRRAFLAGTVTVLAAPLAAQVPRGGRVYRLGLLSGGRAPSGQVSLTAEFPGTAAALRALGYEQGRTFVLEARFAEGQIDRLPVLAAGWCSSGWISSWRVGIAPHMQRSRPRPRFPWSSA